MTEYGSRNKDGVMRKKMAMRILRVLFLVLMLIDDHVADVPVIVFAGCIIIQPSLSLQCYQHQNRGTSCGPGGCNDGTELDANSGDDGQNDNARKRNVRIETCGESESSANPSCFVSWNQNVNSSEKILQFSGCFFNDKDCVGRDKCVSRSNGQVGKGGSSNRTTLTFYCCCDKDLCNYDFEAVPVPKAEPTTPVPQPVKRKKRIFY